MSDKIRNDSGYSVEHVEKVLRENGVKISYGKLMVEVHKARVDEARALVSSKTHEQRQAAMLSVDHALSRSVPKILAGKFSRKRANDTVADLTLWYALKEQQQ
jgi:hypothetical protein